MRHRLQRVLILTIAVIASAIPLASFAYDVRYWVWQRDDPLDQQELAELAAQKIDTITGRPANWRTPERPGIGKRRQPCVVPNGAWRQGDGFL